MTKSTGDWISARCLCQIRFRLLGRNYLAAGVQLAPANKAACHIIGVCKPVALRDRFLKKSRVPVAWGPSKGGSRRPRDLRMFKSKRVLLTRMASNLAGDIGSRSPVVQRSRLRLFCLSRDRCEPVIAMMADNLSLRPARRR
jgi:hypothetical protein